MPTQGGDTQFVNLYDAYDALPAATKKRIDGARLIHYIATQRSREFDPVSPATAAKWPRVVHPLVRIHPETGRKLLYICGERMERVVDMAADESEELLQELLAHATSPRFQYRHQWRQGDIVNRCAMHHANGDYAVGERRYMLRIYPGRNRAVLMTPILEASGSRRNREHITLGFLDAFRTLCVAPNSVVRETFQNLASCETRP